MTIEEIKKSQSIYLQVKDIREYFKGMSDHKILCRIKSGVIPVEHFCDGRYLYINKNSFIELKERNKL